MIKQIIFILILIYTFNNNNNFINCQDYLPVDSNAKCEVYIGDSSLGSTTERICDGYLANPNSIYVSSNKTQLQSLNEIKSIISAIKFTNPEAGCINPTNFKILCAMSFPECVQISNTSIPISLPIMTCNSYCNQALSSCSGVKSMASCDPNVNVPYKLYSPMEWVKYNLTQWNGNDNTTITCSNPTLIISSSDDQPIEVDCVPPLVKRLTNDSAGDIEKGYFYVNSQCVLNCPITGIHSIEVWRSIYKVSDVISIISLICTIILMFTFGVINPKLNRFDKKNLFFILGVFGMSLSGTLIAGNGSENTVCPSPIRYAVNTDKVCVASGFILHFSALFAIQWWTVSVNDIRYGIMNVGKNIKVKIRYYLLFITGTSLAFTLVPLGTGQYQAGASNVVCFLKDEVYQSATFFVPLGVCLTAGTVGLILVMIDIYKIVKLSSSSATRKDSISHIKLQVKPILNVILFYFTFLYLFLFVRVINSRYEEYKESAIPYMLCLIDGGGDNCKLIGPSAGSLRYFAYCLRIFGCYIFLIYFMSSRTIKIWKESIILNNKFILPIIKLIDSTLSKLSSSTKMNTSTTNGGNSSGTSGGGNSNRNSNFNSTLSVELESRNNDDDL